MNKLKSKKGQGTVEFILIVAFVVALAVALIAKVKPAADTKMTNLQGDLTK